MAFTRITITTNFDSSSIERTTTNARQRRVPFPRTPAPFKMRFFAQVQRETDTGTLEASSVESSTPVATKALGTARSIDSSPLVLPPTSSDRVTRSLTISGLGARGMAEEEVDQALKCLAPDHQVRIWLRTVAWPMTPTSGLDSLSSGFSVDISSTTTGSATMAKSSVQHPSLSVRRKRPPRLDESVASLWKDAPSLPLAVATGGSNGPSEVDRAEERVQGRDTVLPLAAPPRPTKESDVVAAPSPLRPARNPRRATMASSTSSGSFTSITTSSSSSSSSSSSLVKRPSLPRRSRTEPNGHLLVSLALDKLDTSDSTSTPFGPGLTASPMTVMADDERCSDDGLDDDDDEEQDKSVTEGEELWSDAKSDWSTSLDDTLRASLHLGRRKSVGPGCVVEDGDGGKALPLPSTRTEDEDATPRAPVFGLGIDVGGESTEWEGTSVISFLRDEASNMTPTPMSKSSSSSSSPSPGEPWTTTSLSTPLPDQVQAAPPTCDSPNSPCPSSDSPSSPTPSSDWSSSSTDSLGAESIATPPTSDGEEDSRPTVPSPSVVKSKADGWDWSRKREELIERHTQLLHCLTGFDAEARIDMDVKGVDMG